MMTIELLKFMILYFIISASGFTAIQGQVLDEGLAPMIYLHPETSVRLEAGEDGVSFVCAAYGDPLPSITWAREDMQIQQNSLDIFIKDTYLLGDNASFIISILEVCSYLPEDGEYSCQAINQHGSESVSFQINVTYEMPTLRDFPMDTIANISDSISFTCSAFGEPLPVITWYKDGLLLNITTTNITETTNGTLLQTSILYLENLQLSDTGEYSCNASNFIPNDTDAVEFTLTVQSASELIVYPMETIANVGDNVTLTCLASGIPPPQITWLRDNNPLTNDLTEVIFSSGSGYFIVSILSICNLQFLDSGIYTCLASNNISEGLSVESEDFTLEVQAPPRVIFSPLDQNVTDSSQVNLTCVVTGFPLPNVQWLTASEDGGVLSLVSSDNSTTFIISEMSQDGVVRSVLTLTSPQPSQGGVYMCVANSSLGMDSSSQAFITVFESPTLISYPGDSATNISDGISFMCIARGNPIPHITWSKDSIPLHSRDRINITTVVAHSLSVISVLQLCTTQLSDNGRYSCTATNAINGSNTNDVREFLLMIFSPPEFTLHPSPENLVIPAGGVAIFSCTVTGIPNPFLSWYRNGTELSLDEPLITITTSILNLYTIQSNITIVSSSLDVIGSYQCLASGEDLGELPLSILSNSSQLEISYPPNLIIGPTDQALFSPIEIIFSCQFESLPVGVVNWTYKALSNSTPTTIFSGDRYNITSDSVFDGIYITTISILTIYDVSIADAGEYMCTADNGVLNLIGATKYGVAQLYFAENDPTIVEAPVNLVVIEGDSSTSLNCAAASMSDLNLSWTKDGAEFTPRDQHQVSMNDLFRYDLTFPNPVYFDSGQYVCTVFSPFLEKTITSSAELVVFAPVSIEAFPGNTTVSIDTSHSFSCLVFGSHGPRITWFKDENEIDISRISQETLNDTLLISILRLDRVQISDTGTYICNASNQVTGILPATNIRGFYLFVQRAPRVYPLLGERIVLDGAVEVNIQFSIVDAVPPVALEDIAPNFLRYDGIQSVSNYSLDNLTSVTFNIPMVSIDLSEGNYSVEATNQAGNSLGSVYLDVQSPPVDLRIVVSGDVMTDSVRMAYVAIEGASVTLTCFFLSDPQPSIQWLHDGVAMDTDQSVHYIILGSIGNASLELVLSSVIREDSGSYTCNGTNIHGYAETVETLVVIVPPLVTPINSNPIGVETRDGSPSEVTVGFSITRAFPAVLLEDITWTYVNSFSMESLDLRDLAENSSKYELSEDLQMLTIYNLSFFDAGILILSTFNEAGRDNASLELIIHVEPVLLNETYDSNVTFENSMSSFTCVADGFPIPNIIWTHNRSLILFGTRHNVSTSTINSTHRPHIPYAVSSTLTISGLRSRDSGEYLCRVDPPVIDRGRSVISSTFEFNVIPVPINYCKSMPCVNGICFNQTSGYLCECRPLDMWKGIDCDIEIIKFIDAKIDSDPESSFPELLQPVSLMCGVSGTPEPNITWYKDDKRLDGERSRSLEIREVELEDRGVYHCEATNFDPEDPELKNVIDISDDAFVNIRGLTQYRALLRLGESRRKRQVETDDSEILNRIAEQLSGIRLDENSTIYSITRTTSSSEDDPGVILILITVIATNGGSAQLTQELNRRLNITFTEIGSVRVETLLRFDGCVADMSVLPPLGGLGVILEWPESDLGVNVTLLCPCGNLSSITDIVIGSAHRLCGGNFITGAVWQAPMLTACNFSITTRRLCQIVEILDEADEAIDMLDNITSNEENIGAVEIGVTTIFLETLADAVAEDSNLSMNFLEVVDNILDADEMEIMMSQQESNSSARILSIIETVAENIPIPENETTVIVPLTSFAIVVREVDPETFQGQDFSIDLGKDFNFDSEMVIDPESFSFEESTQSTASLSIPDDFFMQLDLSAFIGKNDSMVTPRIINSVYLSDTLFLRREESRLEVGSIIISASLSNNLRVQNLTTPITLVFVKKPSVSNGTNSTCNFWDLAADDGFGNWSTLDCKVDFENETLVICKCTHFTNFAILLDPNPVVTPLPPGLDTTLMAFSYIGAILSIICLIMTITTYFSSKKLRETEAGQLLINLSFALLGLYVMFIISFYSTKSREFCAFSGGLLHYFMLATFFLMAVEAVNLYMKLVIVIGIPPLFQNRYVLKSTLIAWILPFFIVLLSEAPNWTNYVRDTFCRPYNAPFYAGLMAPFIIVYIFNWVVFTIIFISLLRKKRRSSGMKDEAKADMKKQLKQNFIVALTLSLLFGLGWGIGLAATSSISYLPVSITLQLIFILFTSFQGVLIFIMHCLRSEIARDEWRRWIYVITCHKIKLKTRKGRAGRGGISTTSGEYSDKKKSVTTSFNSDSLQRYKKNTYPRPAPMDTINEIEKQDFGGLGGVASNRDNDDTDGLIFLNPVTEDFDLVEVKSLAGEIDVEVPEGDHRFDILWLPNIISNSLSSVIENSGFELQPSLGDKNEEDEAETNMDDLMI